MAMAMAMVTPLWARSPPSSLSCLVGSLSPPSRLPCSAGRRSSRPISSHHGDGGTEKDADDNSDGTPAKSSRGSGTPENPNPARGFYGRMRDVVETLRPRQKGDARDILLICLSFALYIYISQRLVCAYCLWKSAAPMHPF